MELIRLLLVLVILALRATGRILLLAGRSLVWLCRRLKRRDFRSIGALGTARWANWFDLFLAGVYRGAGPVIGISWFGRIMRFNVDGIVHVFASTGSGKGLGIVIPTLLDYPGSMLVTDPKGENYAITAAHRRTLGRVIMLNPSDLINSDRFNPMDMIRRDTDHEADDAAVLARLLVRPDSTDPHWDDKAVSMAKAFILAALHDPAPERRNFGRVRDFTTGSKEMQRSSFEDIVRTCPSPLAQSIASGFLSAMGGSDAKAGEFESIVSNIHKATEMWIAGTPAGRLSASSTFSLEELTDPDRPVTIYLCVDEILLETYSLWLRVMTGCVMQAIMRAKYRKRPRHKVLLLLDEVTTLGRLDMLEKQSGLLRAYCTPVLIWQNLPQVTRVYGNAGETLLANASCRVFFGVNDQTTAEYVARMSGQATVRTHSEGSSRGTGGLIRENRQEGQSEGGYWLVDPTEVQTLGTTTIIARMRHIRFPIRVRRGDYRRLRRWRLRWRPWDPAADAAAPVPVPAPVRPPAPTPVPRPPARTVPDVPASVMIPDRAGERQGSGAGHE